MTVNVVISDRALLAGADEAAYVDGGGQVDAELVRELVAGAVAGEGEVELRRLYARLGTGALVAMESGSRLFPIALARFIRLRDRACRTPWCDAPVRHLDHVVEHQRGGPTSATNGQGLCQACNHAKQAPGWHALPRPGPGTAHTVTTVTPTGHLHRTTAPRAVVVPARDASPGERLLADLVWAA